MFPPHLPVDPSLRRRRRVLLLSAVLVAAVLVPALLFSFTARGSAHAASAAVSSNQAASLVSVSSSSTCPPTIGYGSTGIWVKILQGTLNGDYTAKIFPNSPYNFHPLLKQDGIFGPLTEDAVKDYQTRWHLAVDGIVGPQTWHSLTAC